MNKIILDQDLCKSHTLTDRQKDITIAYLVLCHDEPELLRRVATVLNYNEDKVFVHVDKKVDVKPFKKAVAGLQNVIVLDKRYEVFWGGFSSIIATMELIRAALSSGINFDRIILLQGKDYPLHSPEYIHRFFQLKRDEEFCKGKNISNSNVSSDYMKCCGYWCMDNNISASILYRAVRIFLAILNTKIKIKYRRSYFCQDNSKWDVYKGWAQVALTAKCAEYVLSVYDNNGKYNKFMSHRFPPDEIYIHTILYNSHFASKISEFLLQPRENALWRSEDLNLTYFEYPNSVTIFTDENMCFELRQTKALFFRKATLPESAKLLDKIDMEIEKEKEKVANDLNT